MRTILSFLFGIIYLIPSLQAQPEMIRIRDEGVPFFYYDTGNIAADDSSLSRLLINLKIPYDELQFLKLSDTLYQADIELTFIVFDSENDQVEGKSFREKVFAHNYSQTNANKIFYSFQTYLDLPPDKYSLLCEVTDLDSKKTGKQKEKITLRNFVRDSFNVSDLFLLNPQDLDKKELDRIRGRFSHLLSDSAEFLVASFQVYSPHPTKQLKVNYRVKDFRRKVIQKGEFTMENRGFGTRLNIPILKENLAVGNYEFNLKVNDGEEKLERNDVFRTHVANLPVTISNLDMAIEQLRYIASPADIKRMKKAPPNKKQAAFDAYWKKLDPTPGTPTNELMDEYYRRVAFSNAHFSGFREGWKTDMGMVYIILGPPSDVERQPYNVTANPFNDREIYAYELWYYYDINRRFIFVDERGFGEYRLTNPNDIYLNR